MFNESIEDKMANLLIKEGLELSTATVLARRLAQAFSENNKTEIKLPQGIRNLQDYFPTSMLIGGSYARYLEANTKAQLFHPTRTAYSDIDIFIFHNITRCAMEEVIRKCFTTDKLVSVHFENTGEGSHPYQYKMDGIRKVVKFEVFDGLSTQRYDVIIVDPNIGNMTNFFMKQQASELSQICAVPDYSLKGFTLVASQDLLAANRQVHLRADKCTDEFRIKLRKQAQELGYKLI